MNPQAPFKFLDAYQQADKSVFFGREKETNDLYDALSGVKHLLVYGPSGAGKTSLIECGLRNQFSDADWFALSIRRGNNINAAVFARINEALDTKIALHPHTKLPQDHQINFGTLIEQLFEERFQPVYLLFDQFEELLILGSDAEKQEFFTRLHQLIRYKVPCRILLIMREEFIGHLSEFETICPSIFKHRFRLEKMRKEKVRTVIYEMLEAVEYKAFYSVANSKALADTILNKLPDEKREIELTHVQVFLSELWDRAKHTLTNGKPFLTPSLVTVADNLEGVLNSFLSKQLEALNTNYGENHALEVLASMISERHTKLQLSKSAIQKDLQTKNIDLSPTLPNLLQDLEKRRLIRAQKAGEQTQYEISHDLLALAVGQNLTEEMQLRQKAGEVYKVYAERQGYLNQEDLDFIRPYHAYKAYPVGLEERIKESEFFLKEEQEKKIEETRKRTRLFGVLFMLAFSGLVIALWYYFEANRSKQVAESKTEEAVQAKLLEEQKTCEAQDEAEEGFFQKLTAQYQQRQASKQRKIAVQNLDEAEKQKQIAENQKQLAVQNLDEAEKQKQIADRLKQKAEDNLALAKKNEEEANKALAAVKAQEQLTDIEKEKALEARDKAELQQKLAEQKTNEAIQSDSIAKLEKKNAEQTTRQTIANELAFKAELYLDEGNRERAFQLAEFAHLYTDKNNIKTNQQLIKNCHYNALPSILSPVGMPIKTLIGHDALIHNIFFSSDDTRIATASYDYTAKIWNPDTGEMLHTLERHGGFVNAITLSSDGTKIATASRGKVAHIWDVATGALLNKLEKHKNGINEIVFSPDGTKIATASNDSTANIWNAATGEVVHTLHGHSSKIIDIDISPDGTKIATASNNGKVWDINTGTLLNTLDEHKEDIIKVVISPDNAKIATSSYKTTKVWDINTGKLLNTLSKQEYSSFAISFSPDGTKIATVSNYTVNVYNVYTGDIEYALDGHNYGVSAISFSPDGTKIATVSYDNFTKVWDANTGKLLNTLLNPSKGYNDPLFRPAFAPTLAFSSNSTKIATTSWNHTPKIWNTKNIDLFRILSGHGDNVVAVIFSPDGAKIATVSEDNTVKIWNVTTGKILHTLRGENIGKRDVIFSPDGTQIATTTVGNTATVWNTNTGEKLYILKKHRRPIFDIAFSPDGSEIATASYDNITIVWNASSGKTIYFLIEHSSQFNDIALLKLPDKKIATAALNDTGKVWSQATRACLDTLSNSIKSTDNILFSPDETKIATISDWTMERGCVVKLWDVETKTSLFTLNGHGTFIVSAIAFSPDGSKIATASWDHTAKIWDANSGTLLLTLSGHSAPVNAITFSPDGTKVATTSRDSTAKIWLIHPDTIIQKNRNAYDIIPLLAYQIQEYNLAHAMENGLGFTHFLQTAPAAQLHQFGLYYQNTTKNNNNKDFIAQQLPKAEQCFRTAVQKESTVLYQEALADFLVFKEKKLGYK